MDRSPDPRLSFDRVAALYDAARPRYPDSLFDELFAQLPPRPRIVEVGPGTGQATRALLERGACVHAIEIGPAMVAVLRSNLRSPDLRVTVGDFEQVTIAPGSADAVVSACAYHWVSPQGQVDRPGTILEPGGVVGIIDLVQVDSSTDQGFFDAAQPIYVRHGQGPRGPKAPKRDEVDPPIRAALAADDRFTDVGVRCIDWDQTYRAADYRSLMTTYSPTQMMDDDARTALLDDMEQFIVDEFAGVVTRPLVVALTTAVRR